MGTESTKAALERYFQKQADDVAHEGKPKRKNERPEMDLVQRPAKAWFRKSGWSMFVIDAKAEWSAERQAYIPRAEVAAGFSDAVGCTSDGTAAFVEFKAPGKRSTLKAHQREFLTDKIKKGCFAVCVDSVEQLAEAWSAFQTSRKMSRDIGVSFLLRHLPPEPQARRPVSSATDLPF